MGNWHRTEQQDERDTLLGDLSRMCQMESLASHASCRLYMTGRENTISYYWLEVNLTYFHKLSQNSCRGYCVNYIWVENNTIN